MIYSIKYEQDFLEDIVELGENISKEKFISLKKIFENKKLMIKNFPRMYQKLEIKNLKGQEYRRIVLEQYVVIYKIVSNQISFLKIYPKKTNYIEQIKNLKNTTKL